jgi:hypothetical protein
MQTREDYHEKGRHTDHRRHVASVFGDPGKGSITQTATCRSLDLRVVVHDQARRRQPGVGFQSERTSYLR